MLMAVSYTHLEVRLRNAYVIKAERVEKDANGEITTIFCTYDPETLGKNPADGRKVKDVYKRQYP